MTAAAKHYGKRMDNFFANEETHEYADALEAITGIPVDALVQAQRGGAPGQSGTWAHPKLAVFFARWLDVRFAVWCDLTLDEILLGRVEVKAVPRMPPNTPL
jgi:hypothetical protein